MTIELGMMFQYLLVEICQAKHFRNVHIIVAAIVLLMLSEGLEKVVAVFGASGSDL